MGQTDTLIHAEPRKITGRNGGTLTPITSATARDLAKRRWAKFRQAAARRVTAEAQAIDPTATTAAEAWGLAVAKQYTALLDSDKPRGDDMIRIGEAIGAVATARERDAEQTNNTVNIAILDTGAAQALAQALAVLRGEVVDADE